MDCYQFIQDHFHQLNGKLYRPKADSNYLVLALMKDEASEAWQQLRISTAGVRAENQEVVASLQHHFYVSEPFDLETGLQLVPLEQVGTLEKQERPEVRHILTGVVRSTDADCAAFTAHTATLYVMEKIPSSINFMDITYFLPMVAGRIDGYYKVEKVYFGRQNGEPCMKLNLSTYIPLGERQVQIYSKMRPGELISFETMKGLYK